MNRRYPDFLALENLISSKMDQRSTRSFGHAKLGYSTNPNSNSTPHDLNRSREGSPAVLESANRVEPEQSIAFVTMGMFIIDYVYHENRLHQAPYEAMGGAGSFAALGARLFLQPPASRQIGWIVDAGEDFPDHMREEIEGWDTSCVMREWSNRKTARGVHRLLNDRRISRYPTPLSLFRIEADDLPSEMLDAGACHIIGSPERVFASIASYLRLRRTSGNKVGSDDPCIIWEPLPDSMIPSKFEPILATMSNVKIISPNHTELASVFGFEVPEHETDERSPNRPPPGWISELARKLLRRLDFNIQRPQDRQSLVVRAGPYGCLWMTHDSKGGVEQWFPPYHDHISRKTTDTTGCGNAFLGALAVGIVINRSDEHDGVSEGCIMGTIAASLVLEQQGMPQMTHGDGEAEMWNGIYVADRLKEYCSRPEVDQPVPEWRAVTSSGKPAGATERVSVEDFSSDEEIRRVQHGE